MLLTFLIDWMFQLAFCSSVSVMHVPYLHQGLFIYVSLPFLLFFLSLFSSCPSISLSFCLSLILFLSILLAHHKFFFSLNIFCILPLPSFKRMFFSSAPLPHLTSDDVDKALQNSPRLMHARNTGKKAHASLGNWTGALYVHHSLHTFLAFLRIRSQNAEDAAEEFLASRWHHLASISQLKCVLHAVLFWVCGVSGQRNKVFPYKRASWLGLLWWPKSPLGSFNMMT